MKKLNKNIISCSSSLDYWLCYPGTDNFVPFHSLLIQEYLRIHKFLFCTVCELSYGFVWVKFSFFEGKVKLRNGLLKEIYSKLSVNKLDHLFPYCLHILNITVNNYNLAPTIVRMKMKLFKSEYGLCILKNSKQQIHTREILFAYKTYMRHY